MFQLLYNHGIVSVSKMSGKKQKNPFSFWAAKGQLPSKANARSEKIVEEAVGGSGGGSTNRL